MRQAGRYLPGYRAIRKTHNIKEMCQSSDLSVEIMSEPIRMMDLDAAIVFSDIMLPAEGMGFNLEFKEGIGPIMGNAYKFNKTLDGIIPFERKNYIYPITETIKKFKEKNPGTPIIGFSGGPITIMSYLINGSPDKDLHYTKDTLLNEPKKFFELMRMITQMIIDYCKLQISSGVDAIQIFDSWAGFFSPYSFKSNVAPFLSEITSEIKSSSVPLIYFSTGTAGLLYELRDLEFDFLSIDWRIRLSKVRKTIGDDIGLQGNLDPFIASSNMEEALKETKNILADIDYRNRYVFNLGHGVLPSTDPNTLKEIVDVVHSVK